MVRKRLNPRRIHGYLCRPCSRQILLRRSR
ncbi:hypothetical protein ACMSI6_11150 [Pseudomonas antarctica]